MQSGLAEAIDLGDDAAPEIVDVPESEAPQRPKRTRVRKAAPKPEAEPDLTTEPEAAPEAVAEVVAVDLTPTGQEPAPEPEAEPEMAEVASNAEPADVAEAPKRRGWWSRAIGGA